MWLLAVRNGQGQTLVKRRLLHEPVRVGRAADNDVVLRDPRVPRHLARVIPGQNVLCWSDLGGLNPALRRQQPLRGEQTLAIGDSIEVPGYSLVVEADPDDATDLGSIHIEFDSEPPTRPREAWVPADAVPSAADKLRSRMEGIRRERDQFHLQQHQAVLRFEDEWREVIAELRDMAGTLKGEPRVRVFAFHRHDHEVAIKVQPRSGGPTVLLTLSADPPDAEDGLFHDAVWFDEVGVSRQCLGRPREGLKHLVERLAELLA